MHGGRQPVLILLLGFFSICTSSALAAEVPWASLRGLTGVGVVVEELTPDAKRGGLVEEQLRLDVEWRLRKAGIPVLSGASLRGVSGAPYLSISLAALQGKGRLAPLFVYAIQVELKQWGHLGAGRFPQRVGSNLDAERRIHDREPALPSWSPYTCCKLCGQVHP